MQIKLTMKPACRSEKTVPSQSRNQRPRQRRRQVQLQLRWVNARRLCEKVNLLSSVQTETAYTSVVALLQYFMHSLRFLYRREVRKIYIDACKSAWPILSNLHRFFYPAFGAYGMLWQHHWGGVFRCTMPSSYVCETIVKCQSCKI